MMCCVNIDCESPQADTTLYCQFLSCIIYLTHSRLDISFVVNVVFHFMQYTRESHWKEAKHIVHYLKGTIHLVSNIVIVQTHWLVTLTLTRRAMVMIENQLLVLFFASILYLWSSPLRKRRFSLYQLLKQNMVVLSMLELRLFGSDNSWVSSSSISNPQLLFIVTIKV